MKKSIFSLLGLALLFGACEDRLEIEQKGVVSYEGFYKTDDDAQNAVNNLYQSFGLNINGNEGIYTALPLLLNEAGDDIWAAGNFYGDNDFGAAINEFRYDDQNELIYHSYWGLCGVIYDCNTILENVTPESPIKKRVCAEARTIRAWCHLMTAIIWNRPPIIDHLLAGDVKPANSGSQKEVLDWVAAEAEAAAADLDERTSTADKVAPSKASKGFAWAVAGKAKLFAGDYAGAKAMLKKVIDSGKYALVPTDKWESLFHVEGDLCEEMIFQANHVENPAIGDWSNNIQRSVWMWNQFWNWRTDKMGSKPAFIGCDGWGGHAIRADFAKKMLDNDGNSVRRKATFFTSDEFLYEMEWLGEESKDKAVRETSGGIGIKDKGGLYGFENYFAHKLLPRANDVPKGNWGFKNMIVMRYAEVLLMYAEACAQTNDADGLKYLNMIQERAGSAHKSTACTLAEVKNEKMFEMWGEGVRFPDMVRWGDTDGVVNNGKNIPSTKDAFSTLKEGKHRLYVEYSNPNGTARTGFVKGTHEYFPFPYAATSINKNLKNYPTFE